MRNVLSVFIVVLMGLGGLSAYAGPEPELGAVAKHQALLDVGTDLRLMCVAAHPDDEDGATLTYYRKKYGYKTFAVIATRGEGGQNEIGPELYEELGVIRTHEMMQASKHTGAELHFLNYPEFGFSKSAEEAFEVWGKDETVRRMVKKIRELKPDVIITHHDHTSGHGHHRAVSIALSEAFDLSGEPKAFPETGAPWQPARLYWRDFTGEAPGAIEVPISELDPVRGLMYTEMAANALREHESQGMGFFIDRFLSGRKAAHYKLVKESKEGVQGGKRLDPPSDELFVGLRDRISSMGRTLSEGGEDTLTKEQWKSYLWESSRHVKEAAVNLSIAQSNWKMTAKPSDTIVTPGQTFTLELVVRDYGWPNSAWKPVDTSREGFLLNVYSPFKQGDTEFVTARRDEHGVAAYSFSITVPENAAPTLPHAEHVFAPNFLDAQLRPYFMHATDNNVMGLNGQVYVDIAPHVGVEFLDVPFFVQRGTTKIGFPLQLTNYTPGKNEVNLQLSSAEGITLSNESMDVDFSMEDEQQVLNVSMEINRSINAGDYTIAAQIPETGYATEGVVRVIDVVIPQDIHVGVIKSYDDTFLTTLGRMGVSHEALEKDDFSASKLDEFSTIIVDIRAYLVRKDLIANNQAILDYVERGGTVLVMYQKTFEWKEEFAPYPLTLSRNRVTREDARITLLEPKHVLFTTPNAMVSSDWDGWRQERGLYFPSKWDDTYTPLIDVRDPGETPPPGSLLVADYGEGIYMYTALGWYRQLRELHPGTVRMFANMLAL